MKQYAAIEKKKSVLSKVEGTIFSFLSRPNLQFYRSLYSDKASAVPANVGETIVGQNIKSLP